MSRLVNIVMVCVWLVSQLLVVSVSQAHAAMGHQQEPSISIDTTVGGTIHQHHRSDEQHSRHGKPVSSEDQMPIKLPYPADDHSMNQCCDIACQSANVSNASALSTPHETSRGFRFALSSASCWSPGSINPPPNPAA